jgi:hypothetical protein
MSYVLSGYILDIEKLKSIVGSKDASLVEAVMENSPEEFDLDEDEEDDWDDDDDEENDEEDDEVSLATALRQLIMNEAKNPEEAHQYGYALREICAYCGEALDSDMWGGVRWAAVEDCGLEDLLTKTGTPVPLPPIESFPTIGHIRRENLNGYLQAAKERLQKTEDSDIEELLEEYINWLETAADKKQDIIFFYS